MAARPPSSQRHLPTSEMMTSLFVVRPEDVPEYSEYHKSAVNRHGDPEDDFVPERLLEVVEDHEAHGESGNGSGHMSHEGYLSP